MLNGGIYHSLLTEGSIFLSKLSAHDIYIIKYRPQVSCVDKLSDDLPHLFDEANCTQSLLVS